MRGEKSKIEHSKRDIGNSCQTKHKAALTPERRPRSFCKKRDAASGVNAAFSLHASARRSVSAKLAMVLADTVSSFHPSLLQIESAVLLLTTPLNLGENAFNKVNRSLRL